MGDEAGAQRGSDLSTQVYAILRAIAGKQMAAERAGHTLSATALVSEAYLRMASDPRRDAEPGLFYHAAGEAMRRILIEHARKRGAAKRGGGWKRAIESVEQLAAEGDAENIVALDGAFLRLAEEDPRAAEVVRLRFYAGLTVDQVAAVLKVSRRSVLRDWEYGRAFLLADLERGPPSE